MNLHSVQLLLSSVLLWINTDPRQFSMTHNVHFPADIANVAQHYGDDLPVRNVCDTIHGYQNKDNNLNVHAHTHARMHAHTHARTELIMMLWLW